MTNLNSVLKNRDIKTNKQTKKGRDIAMLTKMIQSNLWFFQ